MPRTPGSPNKSKSPNSVATELKKEIERLKALNAQMAEQLSEAQENYVQIARDVPGYAGLAFKAGVIFGFLKINGFEPKVNSQLYPDAVESILPKGEPHD
jgi:hypothetical protein